MKLFGRTVATLGGAVVIVGAVACSWMYLYTADLPPLAELRQYDPAAPAEIHTQPDSVVHVLPGDQLGKYLVSAVVAAEGRPDPRGPIRATVAGFFEEIQPRGRMYSVQIARSLVPSMRTIRHEIDELRLADQIQRHFNERQALTIYLNRVYFGENTYGAEDASIRYFGKHAFDMSLDEAALLAGLIRSPGHDSPIQHPERAVERRNWVIEQMASQDSVSKQDAEQAKAAPLIVKQTVNSQATYDWKRCALKLMSDRSPADRIRVHPGEKLKNIPVVSFEVLESGEVRNAVVSRGSGITSIDDYALTWVRSMRYNERPPGCGIIESQAGVTVDLR